MRILPSWYVAAVSSLFAVSAVSACGGNTGNTGSCGNLAGNWALSGSCLSGDCVLTQNGCQISIACGKTTLSGTVDGAHLTLSTTGETCSGSVGAGAPTGGGGGPGDSSGPTASGTCQSSAGQCTFSVACLSGACTSFSDSPSGSGGSSGSSSSGGSPNQTTPDTCTVQVASGSHQECDYSVCAELSDPASCCDSVTDYRSVTGQRCNGSCTDVTSDHDNCGSCGKACSSLEICQSSGCVPNPVGNGGGPGSGGTTGGAGTTSGGGTTGGGGTTSGGGTTGGGGATNVGGTTGVGGSTSPGGSSGFGGTTGGTSGAGGGRATGGVGGLGGGGSTGGDPCSVSATASTPAAYCGANLGGAANVNVLYWCANEATSLTVTCLEGCHASPVGQLDYCVGDPCASAFNDAVACGSNLSLTADANTLYNCVGHATVGATVCMSGCHASPPGQADYCEPTP